MTLLLAVGLVYTFHFIGFFAFPNSDFVTYVRTGQSWLHFEIPRSMKRAPVFSILTVLAGLPFSGPEANLTGTEWLNSLLLPVWMILVYQIGKGFLGRSAVWVALLAGLNPYVIRQSNEVLAEMTIATVFAATVLCTRKYPKMSYLLAMVCSLTRWDMAAILPAVADRLLGDFKSAADTLVSDTAEKILQKGREQYDVLRLKERETMRKKTINAWNR